MVQANARLIQHVEHADEAGTDLILPGAWQWRITIMGTHTYQLFNAAQALAHAGAGECVDALGANSHR